MAMLERQDAKAAKNTDQDFSQITTHALSTN